MSCFNDCWYRYGDGEEEKWYRACVESVTTDTVDVFFLDWGNSEQVTMSSLRPLCEQFLSLAPQCYPCRLTNVQPITDDWPDEATAWFEDTVTASESLSCQPLVYVDKLYEVDLLDSAESSVAEQLKKKGYAVEIRESEEEEVKFILDVPSAMLDKDAVIQVCISHLDSPDCFWVQVREHNLC